ncbi:gamma-type small acid-soluble spore protein [Neobacillus rhizophilus]|uniref:Small, acid-soluble spore protein gamma-type n=1 Tax=Neobacillus rhizophilus TaxID=2833579 RepID=A0A942U6T8_9BACI|nr:gamma-type small acid-soluble spore protein [Neobacillus rhizophilus]MBS4213476.1 gamma-type small acid-soluble spore protein [Neobacillus rhizophilus]MBU8918114.1 gamma-type small acid-soluble spore protein [Bacillus sp. FJAT-29953]
MANFNQQPNKTSAGTNIQEVRQQNAQSAGAGAAGAGAAGQFGTEFGAETNAQEVRQQNQQSEARKNQGTSGQYGQS